MILIEGDQCYQYQDSETEALVVDNNITFLCKQCNKYCSELSTCFMTSLLLCINIDRHGCVMYE